MSIAVLWAIWFLLVPLHFSVASQCQNINLPADCAAFIFSNCEIDELYNGQNANITRFIPQGWETNLGVLRISVGLSRGTYVTYGTSARFDGQPAVLEADASNRMGDYVSTNGGKYSCNEKSLVPCSNLLNTFTMRSIHSRPNVQHPIRPSRSNYIYISFSRRHVLRVKSDSMSSFGDSVPRRHRITDSAVRIKGCSRCSEDYSMELKCGDFTIAIFRGLIQERSTAVRSYSKFLLGRSKDYNGSGLYLGPCHTNQNDAKDERRNEEIFHAIIESGENPLASGANLHHTRNLRLRHHDPRTSPRSRLLANNYFYVAIQRIEEMHEALHGKPVQAVIHQSGDLRLIDVQQARRFRL